MHQFSREELHPWLVLNLVPGLGPRLTEALVKSFGSPQLVLKASPEALAQVQHISLDLAHKLHDAFRRVSPDGEFQAMEQYGARALLLGQPGYPAALATIHDPPHLLYLRGDFREEDSRAVALVGSRSCTGYGKRLARQIASSLARAGWTIVSGLARGIDAECHRAALDAKGRTLAVLAGGLSSIYPPEHQELAEEICQNGAILAETPMKQPPLAGMFPARNRIISGLSKAVVLVEAAEKSGALVTATHAAEQGRTVMAVPGPVDSPSSGGTHALIRKGAILVRNADDVLEELGSFSFQTGKTTDPARETPQQELPPGLTPEETAICTALKTGALSMDHLVNLAQVGVGPLTGILLGLEMKRLVRRLPGSRFELR
ncbi:MAG: DNA-protecting protein DprA [Gemmataceae bacterium]|nr:DNA-protecting protein DprA [Gemmataceae bacterium]